jgi:hypothetical protein
MTRYLQNSYYGGHIIEDPEPDDPKLVCELCDCDCTDDFEVEHITAPLSIIVCRECFDQDPVEYQSVIEHIRYKQLK